MYILDRVNLLNYYKSIGSSKCKKSKGEKYMSYEEKAQYLFNKYQQAIFLNIIFTILFIYLDLGVKTCLIMAVVFVGLGILTYL